MDILDFLDKETLNLINLSSSYLFKSNFEFMFLAYKWHSLENLKKYGHITFWDTTNITNMNNAFRDMTNFNELLLWNTQNVTIMTSIEYISHTSFKI